MAYPRVAVRPAARDGVDRREGGGFDVALAGGYRTILDENAEPVTGTAFADSPEMYSAGINVGYAGFTVGGSWLREDSELAGGADAPSAGDAFDVGATYAVGPWTVGLTYFTSSVEGAAGGGDDEVDSIEGGFDYALGPGVTTSFSVLYSKWETGGGLESEGTVGLAGLSLSF